MALVHDVNIFCNAGSWMPAFFQLKESMKDQGWTHLGSGDGLSALSTTSGNGNDVLTSSGSGANGMDNSRAWIHMEDADMVREVVLQRGTTDAHDWRIKYSKGDGFSGSAAADTTPLGGADEAFIHGGGTDASPTFAVNILPAVNTTLNGVAQVITEDTDAPYRFSLVCGLSGANPDFLFSMDNSVAGLVATDHDAVFFWAVTTYRFLHTKPMP